MYAHGALRDVAAVGGIVVPCGHIEELISAACALLRDPAALRKRSAHMRACVASRGVTWEKAAKRWNEVCSIGVRTGDMPPTAPSHPYALQAARTVATL